MLNKQHSWHTLVAADREATLKVDIQSADDAVSIICHALHKNTVCAGRGGRVHLLGVHQNAPGSMLTLGPSHLAPKRVSCAAVWIACDSLAWAHILLFMENVYWWLLHLSTWRMANAVATKRHFP